MTNNTIITIAAIIGWSLAFYLLWRGRRDSLPPKVSNDAVKVSILIYRDFLRLYQGAHQQAKEKMAERWGEDTGSIASQVMGLPVESVADHNKHAESGVSWEMEYNPSSQSFITLHGKSEELKWEIYSYLGHMIRTQFGIKTHISVA